MIYSHPVLPVNGFVMLDFAQLLDVARIQCKQEVTSKKRALESLATLLAPFSEEHTHMDILDSLAARERIGGTGLGHGIALPHGRMPDLATPMAAIITLSKGVDFEAPDDEPVDILLALLVPKNCEEAHLQILAHIAKLFSQDELRQQIREADNSDEILKVFTTYQAEQA